MIRKILSLFVFVAIFLAFFVGCKNNELPNGSSDIGSSEEAVSSETSSKASSSKMETSSVKTEISSETQSEEQEEEEGKSYDRPDKEDYKVSSKTESQSIKVYRNPKSVELGCFHFSLSRCEAFGYTLEARMKEFKAIVEAGYFNTYLSGASSELLEVIDVIAENGGTVWLSASKANNEKQNLDAQIENYKRYFEILKKRGYLDLINGFYWDEPNPNEYFLAQTERLYKEFGLRNFPVFACSSFIDFEGNVGEGNIVDASVKLTPETAKYLSDVAFDSYSTDVRDGALNGGKYKEWQQSISPNVVDGKSYYTELRRILQEAVGHPANFWHYPTAYRNYLWGGLDGLQYSDEDYMIANLEFLAEDVLSQQYPGGLILYTYYDYHGENTSFSKHAAVKDENGKYLLYPEVPKWDRYCRLLKETTEKFSSIYPNLAVNELG